LQKSKKNRLRGQCKVQATAESQTTGKVVCPICQMDFSHKEPRKRQGAMNLHKYHCMMKNLKSQHEQQQEKPQECSHTFRLLNNVTPAERQAIARGYTEVCTKCQEVE
jgi:uncharacterized Zn finger protein (UPF0148 family)